MSLYDTLGVPKTATSNEIRKAYLKLARVHHPDKGGDAEKFKEITKANDILTDDKRRQLYDQHGVTDENALNQGFPGGFPGGFPAGFPGNPFEFNMHDLFGNMFNGNGNNRNTVRKGRKPPPIMQCIGITLEQFYLGHQFDVQINRQGFCRECNHTGAKTKEICKKCGGQGHISQITQMGPFAMHTNGPCHDCQGKGERVLEGCKPCSGSGFINEKKNLTVSDLTGKKVAVGDGYAVAEFLNKNYPRIVLERVTDDEVGLQQVVLAEVDAAVMDITSLSFYLSKQVLSSVKVVGDVGFDYKLAFAVPKDKQILQSILDKGLIQISKNDRQILNEKWVSILKDEQKDSVYDILVHSFTRENVYIALIFSLIVVVILSFKRRSIHSRFFSKKKNVEALREEIEELGEMNEILSEELDKVKKEENLNKIRISLGVDFN
jgi:hypothetical protein